jgi:SulP family sulfate permease
VNAVSSVFGGIPGYHALSLTSLSVQMGADGRAAGLVAALVPLAAVVFGASVVGMIPRMVVGGALVFVGLSFIVMWLVDMRRSLPVGEYAIVVAILATIATKGLLPGLVVGLVLAIALFAINYGRIDLVHEVPFGTTYRSNVDRPPDERATLQGLADRVQILRMNGYVFFGAASGLLERIRKREIAGGLRFLLIDLRRVTGMDASAALSFRKIAQLAEASGFELVLADVPEASERQLIRAVAVVADGVVRFEPDLDRGLQWCEDGLLEGHGPAAAEPTDGLAGLPPHLEAYLERMVLPEGGVLLRQGDPPDDMFVLESGRLRVEMVTPEGTRMRLSTVRRGVMVGEIAMYTGTPRTAEVVAETPSVVLRLSRASLERLEAEEPETAAALHRWLATTLAHRLTDSQRAFSALLD